jgi:enoyl-CoA hydratase
MIQPDTNHEPEIICERRGAAGVATLNRPKALNALTHGMVSALAEALDRWEQDPEVTRVVIRGSGEKAFCAGGDIRQLYEAGRAGRTDEALRFWADEYRLNVRIKRYTKPYIALIDGIVMGGGVGVSLHGQYRVAGERYSFAMPEVGIGFFPDVGATYALPRLPGETGLYLALTGARANAAEAGAIGLATHRVTSSSLPAVQAALEAGEPVPEVLARATKPPAGAGPLIEHRRLIDRCFCGSSVEEILAALDREGEAGSAFARDTAALIRTKAPSSLAIALAQVRRGRDLSFEDSMRAEYRIVSRVAAGADFYEGVRAVIVDRDGRPRWNPDSLAGLPAGFADRHFAPLDGPELDLPA